MKSKYDLHGGKNSMPVWCPKCHAMLPEGTPKCTVCGTKLENDQEGALTRREMLALNLYVIGIALIPVIVVILLGLVCVLAWH